MHSVTELELKRNLQGRVFMKKVEPRRFSELIEIALRAGARGTI